MVISSALLLSEFLSDDLPNLVTKNFGGGNGIYLAYSEDKYTVEYPPAYYQVVTSENGRHYLQMIDICEELADQNNQLREKYLDLLIKNIEKLPEEVIKQYEDLVKMKSYSWREIFTKYGLFQGPLFGSRKRNLRFSISSKSQFVNQKEDSLNYQTFGQNVFKASLFVRMEGFNLKGEKLFSRHVIDTCFLLSALLPEKEHLISISRSLKDALQENIHERGQRGQREKGENTSQCLSPTLTSGSNLSDKIPSNTQYLSVDLPLFTGFYGF